MPEPPLATSPLQCSPAALRCSSGGTQLPFVGDITISQIFREGHFVRPTGETLLKLNDRVIFTSTPDTAREIRSKLGVLN